MLTPGDVVEVDLGTPVSSETGLRRSAVIVTAWAVLKGDPNVVQVVPLTTTIRESGTEVTVEPDQFNGLTATSAVQCQHIRAVATTRVSAPVGNLGPVLLGQIRGALSAMLDM